MALTATTMSQKVEIFKLRSPFFSLLKTLSACKRTKKCNGTVRVSQKKKIATDKLHKKQLNERSRKHNQGTRREFSYDKRMARGTEDRKRDIMRKKMVKKRKNEYVSSWERR